MMFGIDARVLLIDVASGLALSMKSDSWEFSEG